MKLGDILDVLEYTTNINLFYMQNGTCDGCSGLCDSDSYWAEKDRECEVLSIDIDKNVLNIVLNEMEMI